MDEDTTLRDVIHVLRTRMDNAGMEVLNYIESLASEATRLDNGTLAARKEFVAGLLQHPKIPLAIPSDTGRVLNGYLEGRVDFKEVWTKIHDLRGMYMKAIDAYSGAGTIAVLELQKNITQ
jgi:hypothetical protein